MILQKQETAEDGKAGLSAFWPWKSTNQGQGQSYHRNLCYWLPSGKVSSL